MVRKQKRRAPYQNQQNESKSVAETRSVDRIFLQIHLWTSKSQSHHEKSGNQSNLEASLRIIHRLKKLQSKRSPKSEGSHYKVKLHKPQRWFVGKSSNPSWSNQSGSRSLEVVGGPPEAYHLFHSHLFLIFQITKAVNVGVVTKLLSLLRWVEHPCSGVPHGWKSHE